MTHMDALTQFLIPTNCISETGGLDAQRKGVCDGEMQVNIKVPGKTEKYREECSVGPLGASAVPLYAGCLTSLYSHQSLY